MRDSKDGTYDKKELPRVDFPKWTCHGEKTLKMVVTVLWLLLLITHNLLLFSYKKFDRATLCVLTR
jgi:hypothetical protein